MPTYTVDKQNVGVGGGQHFGSTQNLRLLGWPGDEPNVGQPVIGSRETKADTNIPP